MRNFLLIGGCGFLGKNIIKALLRVLDDPITKIIILDSKNTIEDSGSSRLVFYQGSISDINLIERIILEEDISTVIHLVSTLLPSSDMNDFIFDMHLVQESTVRIIETCACKKIKFVYLSSGGTIYGAQHGVLSESDNIAPISYYGLSKLQIEEIIKYFNRCFGLDYLILRPSNPYGPGQNLYGKQGLIAVIIGNVMANKPVTIFGDGSNIRDYIYIDDFSYYVAKLLVGNIKNEIVNIGSGSGYSVNQIIAAIEKVMQTNIITNFCESRKYDVPELVLDIRKLKRYVMPVHTDLEIGLIRFYNYIKESVH